MGNSGQLARSKDMGAPLITVDGKQSYDLGKMFMGEEYTIVEQQKNKDTGEVEDVEVTLYRYFEDRVLEQFLTPKPVRWATSGKKTVLSVACGELHILVVARDKGESQSEVHSSGLNQYGQLGHGDQLERHELTPVSFGVLLVCLASLIHCRWSLAEVRFMLKSSWHFSL